MRQCKQFLALLLALVLVLSISGTALAAAPRTYTVRIFGGAQGTVSAAATQTVTAGGRYDFNTGWVTLNDGSKYYVKGIRESGKDNEALSPLSFVVNRDMDLVVAYGLRGNMVTYTIRHVDANGRELATTQTYYGNVGDKTVAAYTYIEGYQPRYYNLTKTLVADASQNVLTFEYVPLTAAQTANQQAIINQANRNAAANATTNNSAVQIRPGAPSANVNPNTANPAGAAGTNTNQPQPANNEPEEILDLDAPQAMPDSSSVAVEGTETNEKTGNMRKVMRWVIGGAAAIALLAGLGAFLLVVPRRKDRDE